MPAFSCSQRAPFFVKTHHDLNRAIDRYMASYFPIAFSLNRPKFAVNP